MLRIDLLHPLDAAGGPTRDRPTRRPWVGWVALGAGVAVLGGVLPRFLSVPAGPGERLHAVRGELASLASVSDRLAVSRAHHDRLERQVDAWQRLHRRRRWPAEALRIVAERLPADVTLTELSLDDDGVVMRGVASGLRALEGLSDAFETSEAAPVGSLAHLATVEGPGADASAVRFEMHLAIDREEGR